VFYLAVFSVAAATSAASGREGELYIFLGRNEHLLHGVQCENEHGSHDSLEEMLRNSFLAVVVLGVVLTIPWRLHFCEI
jgi:hypothetical protein